MGYLIYSLAFFTIVFGTLLYLTRHHWFPAFRSTFDNISSRLPSLSTLGRYTALPSTFREDVEAGLHSSNFDMTSNIESGDSRSGLDDKSKAEVLKIMRRKKLNFDEARRVWLEERMRRQGVGPDGLPRDPKLVTFG